MYRLGLVSVSFRKNTPVEIVAAAASAGLSCIEWGSDIHAPAGDMENALKIKKITEEAGLSTCSYGTYFRIGSTDINEFSGYADTAKQLGTGLLRLWCGTQNMDAMKQEGSWDSFIEECQKVALAAEKEKVTVAMECHVQTATETPEGFRELLRAELPECFRFYWQPNQFRSVDCNLAYAAMTAPYVTNIHVFQWKQDKRFSLGEGIAEWKNYLRCFEGRNPALLLEFMPDDRIETLSREAAILRTIAGDIK